ncbi:hypothetical protein [Falsibacillus pallidus]|uniref:Uncharacterized protein n=1 Tax=Falsibacillus pallidus TaxID=493781 RepID=A0A370GUZ5_9BACI|nr:hypothetical protein [Falsibacillus pallidus]RDI45753.1 hypothetical protein DFR59_102386 [Falsibacillus pallidus]
MINLVSILLAIGLGVVYILALLLGTDAQRQAIRDAITAVLGM